MFVILGDGDRSAIGVTDAGGLGDHQAGTSVRWSAVITRMSELFLRTLRDDPADAEVPSHKLLIRAGYIRPVGPGLYSWLPLGLRVLRKIEAGRPRRDDCHWRTRDSVPRAAAQGPVRDDEPLDRVRRRRVPA